jgi:CRP-like cAMP-binding protein
MQHKKSQRVDWESFLARISSGKLAIEYLANLNIFAQGDPADSVFYLRRGKVKLAVRSKQGREAIVAILGDGEFFGEGFGEERLADVSEP